LSSEAERRRRIDLNLQTVFRGIAPGDDVGPCVSQFMLMGNSSLESKLPLASSKNRSSLMEKTFQ
jgi:hypothetical protein